MNKIILSKEEMNLLKEITIEFLNGEDKSLSLRENIIKFYMSKSPDADIKDAEFLVQRLINGVNFFTVVFNQKLHNDLNAGKIDFSEEIGYMSENLENEEAKKMYVSFLSFLATIDIENLDMENMTFKKLEEKFQDMSLDELKKKINEMLNNNSLCLTSLESIQELFKNSNEEMQAIIIKEAQDDLRVKLISAMATYIAGKNGKISSINPETINPEIIAIGAAAGIEQQKVCAELSEGEISEPRAVRTIKIIIAVLLIAALICLTLYIIGAALGVSMIAIFALIEESIIACMAAVVVAVFLSIGLIYFMLTVGAYVVSYVYEKLEKLVDYMYQEVLPVIKIYTKKFQKWLKNLFNLSSGDDSIVFNQIV